jgi:DNA primase
MSLGPIKGAAVRLTPAAATLWLTEGVEDGLSLIQMMRQACWATLGTSNMPNVELPGYVKRVVLAPDNDFAGQTSIAKAARRFEAEGREVWVCRPPEGQDWNDLLGDYEERAAIAEFDGLQPRPVAEDMARTAALGGGNG